jgi:hypothetical protein
MPFKYIFILISCLFITVSTNCQDQIVCFDGHEGSDPFLINGKIYSFFPPPEVRGNPFLFSDDFLPGQLLIMDRQYTGQLLKYDIFNQQLLLNFTTTSGANEVIVVSEAWLQSFSVADREFILRNDIEKNIGIYQIIGDGKLEILCKWEKKLELMGVTGNSYYEFRGPFKKMYLQKGDSLFNFKNNRTFLDLMEPSHRNDIRKFMRAERIRLKKASDDKLNKLIGYCNSLL